MPTKPRPLVDRFWPKVDKNSSPTECWLWTATKSRGYGYISEGGRKAQKFRRAHRVSWELAYGPIPAGLYVLHRCDDPSCVNPRHLFLGTQKDNIRDAVAKGRHKPSMVRGERVHNTNLTADDVRQARRLKSEGRTYPELAHQFDMSISGISKVVRGVTWGHVR